MLRDDSFSQAISWFGKSTRLIAGLLCLLPLQAQTTVTLLPVASPSIAQVTITTVTVTGSGFPDGAIAPSGVTLTVAPAAGGKSLSTPATAVQQLNGSTWRISFQIPGPIALSGSTPYQITLAGTTTAGASFASGNSAAITLDPAARIVSVSPATGNAGANVQVTITGLYTNFLQGATQANFGPGISVGGGAGGHPGPVTVMSSTTAIAQLAIDEGAALGNRSILMVTGQERPTGTFNVGPPGVSIDIDMTSVTTIAPGISGFNDGHLITAVEYFDPKFVFAVQGLKPGWIRFPGGTPTMAYDWQAGQLSATWLAALTASNPPLVDTFTAEALVTAQELTQVMGGVYFKDFANFIKELGVPGIVCFNSYTDTNPESAANMVATADKYGLNILEWELSNEPYFYPVIYPSPAAYATAMFNPYFLDINTTNPYANVGLFFEGKYDFYTSNYTAWDNAMAAYSPHFWRGVSTHVYPIIDTNISVSDEEMVLNGVLAHGTNEYISSYLAPVVGADTPIYITEMNSSVDKVPQSGGLGPNGLPDYTGAVAFESYLYNGIFLAEYVTRMATAPNVKAVGVTSLYLGNEFNFGMIRAVDDHQAYLIGQLRANPNYSTNTATDPNTQYNFFYSAPGVAVGVVNYAINNSTHIWPTAVTGGPMVPIHGFDNKPVPAVFAQGFLGDNGVHYLVITNKSGLSLPVNIQINGNPLASQVNVAYVSNPSDTAQNAPHTPNLVGFEFMTATNPITIGPYSVTRVEW